MQQLAKDHWRASNKNSDSLELGRRAFLTGDDYRKVLIYGNQGGSEGFIKKLAAGTKPLILAGISRPTEQERAMLRELLADSGGDPLNALNLAGVPPLRSSHN
jgi:hypothetical protein